MISINHLQINVEKSPRNSDKDTTPPMLKTRLQKQRVATDDSKRCRLSQSLKQKLHTQGYVILKNVFEWNPKYLHESIKLLKKQERAIFNNSGRNDTLRRQCEAAPVKEIEKVLQRYFPNKVLNGWYLLRSLPGCAQQIAHADYQPSNEILTVKDEDVPLAALTCISESAELLVWESLRYRKVKSPVPKLIRYDRCDLLVFRGDLIHAGSNYDMENIRLHVYLDSPIVPREMGKTFKVVL